MKYTDLHLHLYGCIPPQVLYEIGKNNKAPRWNLFTDFYEEQYGIKINPSTFFTDYPNIESFKKLYLFTNREPFLKFQAKFNLIIALVKFDIEEIKNLTKQIITKHYSNKVTYSEYRVMYAPNETKQNYYAKMQAACLGISMAESDLQDEISARLVVSLHRQGNYIEVYGWLKEFMQIDKLLRKYLVGIDFCNVEEHNPPKEKKSFFEKVFSDNIQYPSTALSILYHVGESYTDKSPKSAVRWVIEASQYGAHRLGHCLSLGIDSKSFLGTENLSSNHSKVYTETVDERIDQIQFELTNYDRLKKIGVTEEKSVLQKELESLSWKNRNSIMTITVDEKYCNEVKTLQSLGFSIIKEKGTVIETCPSSNLYIGMIPSMVEHPIHRFIDARLPLAISCDDPGIFDTNIQKEYALCQEAGISKELLEKINQQSFSYTSEKLSGRIK